MTLADLAAETGATPATPGGAVRGAEVVVVAIPETSVPVLPDGLFATRATGAPIVDTGNYYPRRDGRIEGIERGLPERRWVEQQIGTPVIKTFNSITAHHLLDLGQPPGTERRVARPVAGDDATAKQTVMRLVEELGFDVVDAGGLDESWRQQPGAPCYLADLDAERLRVALANASPERPALFRG